MNALDARAAGAAYPEKRSLDLSTFEQVKNQKMEVLSVGDVAVDRATATLRCQLRSSRV